MASSKDVPKVTIREYNELVKVYKQAIEYSHVEADLKCSEILKMIKAGKTTVKEQLAKYQDKIRRKAAAAIRYFQPKQVLLYFKIYNLNIQIRFFNFLQ